jgi:hypothetical protein
MKTDRVFLTLWVLAVGSATAAFVFHVAMRVRAVELGYGLGRTHAHVARLREVKHVLELELASHKTPERVEFVARTLLGMSEPSADRILPAGAFPNVDESASTQPSPAAPTGEPAR